MPVVLVSRGTMSGVALLVKRFHEMTGLPCVSREDLVPLVNRHGALAQRVVETLGHATEAYEHFCELRRPYVVLMRTALLQYVARDNVLYHGYSGHLLLPSIPHLLTVRIQAPVELRVRMTMERLHCDEADAREYIREDDDNRIRWARFMYGKDIRDSSQYDLCINLERRSIETVCNIIAELIEDPTCQATAASRHEVEQLRLTTAVEAALVTDPRTELVEATAQVADGTVRVIGPYLEDAQVAAVLEVARGVAGVGDVEYQCGFVPAFGS